MKQNYRWCNICPNVPERTCRGNQHYQIVPFFHPQGQMDLDAQIWRDWKKKALCYREGVILITIPYCVVDLETFIRSALYAFGYLLILT
ncbi:P8.141C-like protein [Rhizophagus irregularis DAOM 181602=DAOM 197198]|nr:P8.141C-like protein [Rhizophagus irregularis DAOM 181602=DAOM 197198]